jgi:hypothetical protein
MVDALTATVAGLPGIGPQTSFKTADPVVSVLMLTCNRPQFLNRAIESVISQNFQD